MKSSTQDKVEGKIHEVKGAVKGTIGRVADKPELEIKGKAEKISGQVQTKVGQVKKVFDK